MKDEHTAGPWEAVGDEILAEDGDVCVAAVPMGLAENPTEWQANLRLIAAAPTMLIALRAIKRTCPADADLTREFHGAWGLLEAAIAKAEGQ